MGYVNDAQGLYIRYTCYGNVSTECVSVSAGVQHCDI